MGGRAKTSKCIIMRRSAAKTWIYSSGGQKSIDVRFRNRGRPFPAQKIPKLNFCMFYVARKMRLFLFAPEREKVPLAG